MRQRNSAQYRPTASHPRSARAVSQSPNQLGWEPEMEAMSTRQMLIHEQVQFPRNRHGAGAQHLKIVRIEQASVGTGQKAGARSLKRPADAHSRRVETRAPVSDAGSESPLIASIDGRSVALRQVDETVEDEAGNLFEVADQGLRPLDEIVMDEAGNLFEVYPTATPHQEEKPINPRRRRSSQPVHGRQPRSKTGEPPEQAARRPHSASSAQPGQSGAKRTASRGPARSRPGVAAQASHPAKRRCEIPRAYLQNAHFQQSREAVLYDMQTVLGTAVPNANVLICWGLIYPLRLIKLCLTWLASRRRMKKWRALVNRKTPEEQLWSVPPPQGFSYLPAVRRWAVERLSWCGYEPERMSLEWEIYWRRKGWW